MLKQTEENKVETRSSAFEVHILLTHNIRNERN